MTLADHQDDNASRYLVLPKRGRLMVSTDLHGNHEDFDNLKERFLSRAEEGEEIYWVILGDLVHGPDEQARIDEPSLYGYPDESWRIVEDLIELRAWWHDRVKLVLGNHDHGHIGGPQPAKFYANEVAHLEESLDEAQSAALAKLFRSGLLLVIAPCGVVLCHGSPDESLHDPAQLDNLSLDVTKNDARTNMMLSSLLTSYGQSREVTERVLFNLSLAAGCELNLLVHGHDRDIEGWFVEGGNQLCPVIFGAPRENKRYLELDLSARYRTPDDIRVDRELVRLY